MAVDYDKSKIRSNSFKSIINACLQKDPAKRPKIGQLCRHKALKDKIDEINALIGEVDIPAQVTELQTAQTVTDLDEDQDDLADEIMTQSNMTETSMDSEIQSSYQRENWIYRATEE